MQCMVGLELRSPAAKARHRIAALRTWPVRRWLVAGAVAAGAALVIGVPTGIIETSFYTRMTPVRWWDYPVWGISALLVGLTAATYVRMGAASPARDRAGRTIGATVLSTFAVGCPICNKLVVAALGVSGALTYWAPIQPALGVLSIALLATGLVVRLGGDVSCALPAAPAAA
jgi:hypothetical protein